MDKLIFVLAYPEGTACSSQSAHPEGTACSSQFAHPEGTAVCP
ncbi:hypothetical protein ACTJKB_11065 [Paenibacillus sp. 22594]